MKKHGILRGTMWGAAMAVFTAVLWCAAPGFAQSGSGTADLDQSGFVDADDLLIFLQQWHTEGAVVLPTPADTQVNSEILGVTIPEDLRPVVTLSVKDDSGNPITPSSLSVFRFLIARIIEDNLAKNWTHYENYLYNAAGQATFDQGGQVTDLGNGVFQYRFNRAIANVNPALTHTMTIQMEYVRNGRRSIANPVFHWVPNGSPVTVMRETSSTATCNSCHDDMAFHGGGRKEYVMCLTCHHPGVEDPDTGNTVDMKVMIHKIHMGVDLPSVQSGTPYQIIGFGGSVHDYSSVVFPQDHRNCTTCHTGPQADLHKQAATRESCGSCHDDVNFASGAGHGPGIPQLDDNLCSNCHAAVMTAEFDNSVPGTHVIPEKSAQLPGFHAEIVEITGAVAGATPTVTFKLYQDDLTPVAFANVNRLRIRPAGPTSDYEATWQENVTAVNTTEPGTYQYTLATPLPADAQGTWGFAIETRISYPIVGRNGQNVNVLYVADNVVGYAAVTGNTVPRRMVVDQAKCDTCHDRLALHGGARNQVEYCVMCHNPSTTDEGVRPAGAMPPATIDMKVMIHKIHMGEHLPSVQDGDPYVVYGFNGSVHDYSHVRYPGFLNNCEACHLPGTYFPPAPTGAQDTVVTQGGVEVSRLGPQTAACMSCHDSAAAMAHALSNTAAPGGDEACAICHGQFRSSAVDLVHARD